MERWLFEHASALYWSLLVAGSVLLGACEKLRPRRIPVLQKTDRWLLHVFLSGLTDGVAILVLRVSAVAVAIAVHDNPHGVLNRASFPFFVAALLTLLLLDLYQYANHYLRHSIPVLWRFHQVHHADRDVDFSTGIRFHPVEALITQTGFLLLIAALAPSPSVVLCYELASVAQSLFSHSNLKLPPGLEKTLRLVLVTPEFHESHHSVDALEQMRNLSVLFSFWDRLFHTYSEHPGAGDDLAFGVEEVSAAQSVQPLAMLKLPFAGGSAKSLQTERSLQPTFRK